MTDPKSPIAQEPSPLCDANKAAVREFGTGALVLPLDVGRSLEQRLRVAVREIEKASKIAQTICITYEPTRAMLTELDDIRMELDALLPALRGEA